MFYLDGVSSADVDSLNSKDVIDDEAVGLMPIPATLEIGWRDR